MKTTVRALLPAFVLLSACGKAPPPPPPPPGVLVAHPLSKPVADWDDYSGRFEAVDAVDVKPRVSGAIESVHFTDGAKVAKGQLLFVIDPRPYAAQLAKAKADLARAKAGLANADAELRRAQSLAATQLVSQAMLDLKSAAQLQATAEVAAAEAAVETQTLNLSFTRISAPIAGRVSWRRLAPGNIVTADTTLLTTLQSQDPIRFVFNAPEAALLKYRREAGGAQSSPVEIRLPDEKEYRFKGRMDFLDNEVDRGSGTVRARAVVPNADGFLSPGLFGQLRLYATAPAPALLVPDQAVVTDQTRQVVYVVDAEGTIGQKVVKPGRLVDGLRVIREGLTQQDKIVISGVQRARPGRKVTVTEGEVTAYPTGVSRGENGALEKPAGGLH